MARKIGSMSVGTNVRYGLRDMLSNLKSFVRIGAATGKDQYLGKPRNTGTKWVIDIFERD